MKNTDEIRLNMDKPHHHIVLIGILCLVMVAYCAGIIFSFSSIQITNYGDREPVGFLIDRYYYSYNIRPHKFIISANMFQARSQIVVSLHRAVRL